MLLPTRRWSQRCRALLHRQPSPPSASHARRRADAGRLGRSTAGERGRLWALLFASPLLLSAPSLIIPIQL